MPDRQTAKEQRPAPVVAPPERPLLGVNPLRLPNEQRSLFGEILDWMLAPLLLVWPMSVTLTFVVAQSIANPPFDRRLAEAVTLLADHLQVEDGRLRLKLGIDVDEVLAQDPLGSTSYMVLGLRGELVAGDADMPLPATEEDMTAGTTRLRFDSMRGNEVRIAYRWVRLVQPQQSPSVLVQVGETLDGRTQLANEIIRGVIVPQFVVLPVAILLVWFALGRGLAPLTALQARIRRRRPEDRAPIDARAAPEEIAPLVESFNELLARLSASIEVQQRFIADAAHQLKTPLAGLRTQSELALRQTDPQELKRSLRQIAASSEGAARLVNQLLALARAEHRSAEMPTFELVDLAALIREVVRDWVPQSIERRIDLGFETDAGDTRIVGAPLMLRELANNLIDNALRYTPSGGAVTVRVVRQVAEVVLEVEDTGCGIVEADRARVFDRFYRVLGSKVEGSGLGLAIVREIAEQHDAQVSVGASPRATDRDRPGALFSVRFAHRASAPPTLPLKE